MRNKKLILTFDYELYLGIDSGTVQKCIIEPTDIILDLLNKHRCKGIIFVDATYLLKLAETGHKDLKIINEQICRIIRSGNNVELHLHPQWLDSYKISDEKWRFKSFERYSLHSLNDEEIGKIFKDGIRLLENMIHKTDKNYKIRAFRAGGWAIQPFYKLKNHFIKNNIYFDFSVNPGLYSGSYSYAYYDFREAPDELDFWRIDEDPCKPDKNGIFIEIPVSTLKVKKIDLWLNYYLFKKNEKRYGNGNSIEKKTTKTSIHKKITNLFKLYSTCYSSISIDGLSNKYFMKFVKKYEKNNKNYLTVVCHPKELTKNSLKNLEYLLNNYKTMGIKELYEELF